MLTEWDNDVLDSGPRVLYTLFHCQRYGEDQRGKRCQGLWTKPENAIQTREPIYFSCLLP